MEMSNFMPEFHHVAQQSRRDKLRVQNINNNININSSVTSASSSQHNLEDYNTSFQQQRYNHDHHHHHHHHYVPHGASAVFPSEMRENSTVPTYSSFVPQSVAYTDFYPSRFVVGSSTVSNPREMGDFKPLSETWVTRTSFGGATAAVGLASASENNYQHNSLQIWGNSSGGNYNELPLLPASFISTQPENLSLSLSSHRIREIRGLGEEQEVKPQLLDQSGGISSVVNQSVGGKELTASHTLEDEVYHHIVGPLGPFTGYTTILKSSKFLRPAQYLLDEFLSVAGLARPVADVEEGVEIVSGSHYYNRAGKYSRFGLASKCNGSSNLSCSGGSESCRSDCHDKKAKLLHMQEELCKRHKQYHQQMQMVTSAFESVPGLANATPYISRSIKTISRHFRCLKNAIADQLNHIRTLGGDLSSPTSFPAGDGSNLMSNNRFTKVKSGSHARTGYQNHIWRPQRGLPERAVSILRAWLFDHFLHPYPTDTDKQLLASKTGLSRNQVSNWFINARVRLWKPMVEEIHMLDTKATSHYGSKSTYIETSTDMNTKHIGANISAMNALPEKQQLEYVGSSSSVQVSRGGEEIITEQLFQKRSRMENHYPTTVSDLDGPSLVGFLPYPRRGLEMGGIGAVSLTLGLRHGSETTQQQLQHHFQSQGMHYGGNIIQNFPG